jgi:integrase
MAWIEQIGTRSWRVRYRRTSGSGYGTISSFPDAKTAEQYAQDMQTDRRRGTWIDPAASKTTVASWVERWVPTLDVEIRTEENYRSYLRNHILPRWGHIALGDITALDTATWLKQLRSVYAAATVTTIRCVFSMLLDDAVAQHLIPTSPGRQNRRRGRRRDHAPTKAEKIFAMPEHVLRIAAHATELGGPSAGLLVITAAWTGCRWGEITGLQRDHVDLRRGVITIDPDYGALHESAAHGLWLGPPKTPASARTITLPQFLVELLREHLAVTDNPFVFTTRTGRPIRRSTFDRRVFRPAVDGDVRRGLPTVRPGLTFHGLRHSHKTWLIADHIPRSPRPAGSDITWRIGWSRSTATSHPRSNNTCSTPSNSATATPGGLAAPKTPGHATAGHASMHITRLRRSAPSLQHGRNRRRRSSPASKPRNDRPLRTRTLSRITPAMRNGMITTHMAE